jgi:heavy metal translocating P-type ATPase
VTWRWAQPLGALLALLIGLALRAGPNAVWGPRVWLAGLIGLGLPVVWRTARGALAGRFAADLVASLSIITAVVLVQPLAGLVVVLMQTGGEALEHYAAGRASRAVAELEAAAPHRATRFRGERTEEITAEQVQVGDRLLIRPGDMLPCDAVVLDGRSHVDASRITGEPIPVAATAGTPLMSGSLNLDGPLVVEARALARESQYARIVQLVRQAQESKSPLQRLADRYAVLFTPLTLAVCLVAWLAARDPLRVLAVLVVATPCPLILAAPVAMIGGISRAARRSVIVRNGEALERLGQATVALLDKTGTLTIGHPAVSAVDALPGRAAAEVLGFAAAVDAGSGHLLARSIAAAAEQQGIPVPEATGVQESPGQGVVGRVGEVEVAVGARTYLARRYGEETERWPDGHAPGLRAWVAVDGRPAGIIEFADQLRAEAPALVRALRELGFRRIIMVTGDHAGHAAVVARAAEVPEYHADLLPAAKVQIVDELERAGDKVLMMGDGTNDAPALSRASVGVALAAHGGGITAEAADVVVLADDPTMVAEAVRISRRTLGIAKQSIWAGLGLSGVAMLVAALGHIPPTIGALIQEAIDVAVILNALRASGGR